MSDLSPEIDCCHDHIGKTHHDELGQAYCYCTDCKTRLKLVPNHPDDGEWVEW